jgi:hypothetical protein
MAKVFLTNINLKGNQLLNAALQPASSAPNASGAGQVYYNTNTQALYFSTGSGTGNWQQLAAGTTSVASLNNVTGSVTLQGTADYITVDTSGSTITINIDTKVATTDGTQTLENKTLLEPTLKGRISLTDGNNNETAYIEHSYTGTTRITAGDDLALRSTDGDIILYPGNDNGGPGRAYVHWGNDATGSMPQNEITTAGNTQNLTNKTVSDNLHFDDGTSAGYINGTSGTLNVHADNDLALHGQDNINLTTGNGNIVLNPDGNAYLWNSGNSDNRIATIGDLNSGQVVQSVSGSSNQIVANTDSNGDVTLSLDPVTQIKTDQLYPSIVLNSYNPSIIINDPNTDSQIIEINNNGSTAQINANSGDLNLNAQNNMYLQPNGNLYVNTNNAMFQRDIDLARRLRIGGSDYGWDGTLNVKDANDNTKFTVDSNGGSVYLEQYTTLRFGTYNDSDVARLYVDDNLVLEGNNGIQLNSYNGNNLNLYAFDGGSINLESTNGGQINLNSHIDATDQWMKINEVDVNTIYSKNSGDDLTLLTWDETAFINLKANGNIELLPTDKAYYGSSATAGNEIARISDLQALSSGLDWKQAVNVLADVNVPLTGSTPLTVDSHTLSDGYRVLLTAQSTPIENGIYNLAISGGTYELTRSLDADTDAELKGAAVFVMEGNTYGSTSWVQSNHYITNFTGQDWVQFSGQGTYTGSNSIYLDGNSINVVADGDRGLNIDGDGTYVKIGDGIQFVGGNVSINPGTGFDTTSGALEFASGYGVRKYTDEITGDNSTDSFAITHNLGTRDVTVQIYQSSGTPDTQWQDVEADIVRTSTNAVTISFASAPTNTTTYNVVIVG